MTMGKVEDLESIIARLKKELPFIQKVYGVESLSVFGSYSRGEQQQNSDLDLLVTFYETPGFFQFIRLENYLSDLLEVKVDLVMRDAVKNHIAENISNDLVSIP